MIQIETIDLTPRGVTLPNDRVGMVIAQPHLSLTVSEPYRCLPDAQERQLAVLTDTLAVARLAAHGAPKTHFTVFPEYSIPGLAGVAHIEATVRAQDWPRGTVVIGGTDALDKAQFTALATAPETHINVARNSLDRIAEHEWVNCGITWVKAMDGTVERWLQPKLHPAWPEQNTVCQAMFHGRAVFTFKGRLENGTLYRFCSLVCFDWVATMQNRKAWEWVAEDLRQQAVQAEAEIALSWIFVIQCNRKPSADSFLVEVGKFFDQTAVPNVRRDRACLVFANSAGQASPGRAKLYGNTSVVFSTQSLFSDPDCPPTFSGDSPRFRSSTLLKDYKDMLFRENGACIHSFVQVNPNSVAGGAAGRTLALENAFVFPLNGTIDPRTPSSPVPASIKWLNDELDELKSLGDRYPGAALAEQVKAIHQDAVVPALRMVAAAPLDRAVKLAAMDSKAKHADRWGVIETEAVEHLVHTVEIISLAYAQVTIGADPAHATVTIGGHVVDVVAIRGTTHEDCIEHAKGFLIAPGRQVLLVSRDRDNTHWVRKFGSFLQPIRPVLGERNITDPVGGALHLGYQRLLEIFRTAAAAAAVQGAINAELAA